MSIAYLSLVINKLTVVTACYAKLKSKSGFQLIYSSNCVPQIIEHLAFVIMVCLYITAVVWPARPLSLSPSPEFKLSIMNRRGGVGLAGQINYYDDECCSKN